MIKKAKLFTRKRARERRGSILGCYLDIILNNDSFVIEVVRSLSEMEGSNSKDELLRGLN